MLRFDVFDKFAEEYDRWFDSHIFAYQSEVYAIRRFIPDNGTGIEIGIGTGRFSVRFGIKSGVEPSEGMAAIGCSRGIDVCISQAEQLPYNNEQFDFALIVTTLCFVDNPMLVLNEARRILKPDGQIIIGIIDKETQIGKTYESMKVSNKFYNNATFYSTQDVIELLQKVNFSQIQICQTIFSNQDTMKVPDIVKDGSGEGVFVVLSAIKLK
ncbi:MAG: hypothetical protein A2V93_03490 [Ignavibacteria bacterium RBG_16_34_14]|nr:MAG: hypothetical protein A2V93_03490 [Ignavibacteria bacterium RBG_16_34_14]